MPQADWRDLFEDASERHNRLRSCGRKHYVMHEIGSAKTSMVLSAVCQIPRGLQQIGFCRNQLRYASSRTHVHKTLFCLG